MHPHDYGLTKAAYSVNETLNVLSIGRTSLYMLVKRGDLKPSKLGRKTLFTAADIAALLTKLQPVDTQRSTPRRSTPVPTSIPNSGEVAPSAS